MDPLLERIESESQQLKQSLEKDPEHPNLVPLRRMNHYCSKRIFETGDQGERFLCFVISTLMNSFFFNLGGDTPYDKELQRARVLFILETSENLDSLTNAVKTSGGIKDTGVLAPLYKMLDSYVEIVNLLNRVKLAK